MGQVVAKAAKLVAMARASVPVAYVSLGLNVASDLGVQRETLLKGIGIAPAEFERQDGRVSLAQCVRLISRVMRQTPDHAALGYEFGLRSNLAAHGNIGYGLMSHATVGEALAFGLKYGRLRNPVLKLSLSIEKDQAVIDARPTLPLGPMRQYAIDAVLISMVRIGRQLSGSFKPQIELRLDCAEPPHYARYRHRLPPVQFRAGVNQMRFPAAYLQRSLRTGNPSSAKQVAKQCEHDLALLGDTGQIADQVRAALAGAQGVYPNLEAIASRLRMSGRSLKRRLHEQGLGFLELLEEARKRDSLQWLSDPALAVGAVAERVGYSDPASFTRAFRKWTGLTPTAWRTQKALSP